MEDRQKNSKLAIILGSVTSLAVAILLYYGTITNSRQSANSDKLDLIIKNQNDAMIIQSVLQEKISNIESNMVIQNIRIDRDEKSFEDFKDKYVFDNPYFNSKIKSIY